MVSHLSQVAIDGDCSCLAVQQLDDRVFKFSVSTKEVGFFIYNLRSFECEQFKINFHLWGNGGPQSNREQAIWEKEEADQWTLVNRKRSSTRSYADAVKSRSFDLGSSKQVNHRSQFS